MLSDARIEPTIPVTDLEKARSFYEKRLGLTPSEETETHLAFDLGEGTRLTVFERATATSGDHTAASFVVDERSKLEEIVADLEEAGVAFETFPEMGAEIDGVIHTFEGYGSAWMRDPAGNLIAISHSPRED